MDETFFTERFARANAFTAQVLARKLGCGHNFALWQSLRQAFGQNPDESATFFFAIEAELERILEHSHTIALGAQLVHSGAVTQNALTVLALARSVHQHFFAIQNPRVLNSSAFSHGQIFFEKLTPLETACSKLAKSVSKNIFFALALGDCGFVPVESLGKNACGIAARAANIPIDCRTEIQFPYSQAGDEHSFVPCVQIASNARARFRVMADECAASAKMCAHFAQKLSRLPDVIQTSHYIWNSCNAYGEYTFEGTCTPITYRIHAQAPPAFELLSLHMPALDRNELFQALFSDCDNTERQIIALSFGMGVFRKTEMEKPREAK